MFRHAQKGTQMKRAVLLCLAAFFLSGLAFSYAGYRVGYHQQEARVRACGETLWHTMNALNSALSR